MASATTKIAIMASVISGLVGAAFYARTNGSTPVGDFVSEQGVSEGGDFPGLTPPPGHVFCVRAGPSMRSEGFFTPLNPADKCEAVHEEELPPRVHLAWAGPASEFSDRWADFQARCVVEPQIVSAEFADLGTLADGLPTATCAKVQVNGVYVKSTLIMEGAQQEAFFYTVTAYAPAIQRRQADQFLAEILKTLKVNKRTP